MSIAGQPMQEGADNLERDITALRMELAFTHGQQADEDVSYVLRDEAQLDDDTASNNNNNNNTSNTLALGPYLGDINMNTGDENVIEEQYSESDLEAALLINKEYQDTLNAQLRNIEAAIARNQELQKKYRARAERAKNPHSKRAAPQSSIGKRVPGIPYFTDQDGLKPPENEDTVELRPEIERSALAFRFKKWNKFELTKLAEGVRNQNKQQRFDALLKELDDYKIEFPEFGRRSKAIEEIPELQLEQNTEGINWAEVANQIGTQRSPMDCKVWWINNESPTINKQAWTKEEDTKLVKIAKKHKGFNWTGVAQELGTNRAAIQCMRRFQRNLNTNIVKTSWTAEEDALLAEAVKKFGERNWQQIAHQLVGRTGQQCLHRWDKTLKPTIKKGRWSAEEDKKLLAAVELVGAKSWVKVAQHVQGRTDMQCRERWVNVLNPQLSKNTWAADEDERLQQAIAIHGLGKWSQVSTVVRTRTDNQCWRRWKSLNPGVVDEYREAIGGKAKKPRSKSRPDTEEQELKKVAKRRKIDIRNARKVGKALGEGVQSALEPEEPIHVESVPPPVGQMATNLNTETGDRLRNEPASTPKRGRGRPPKSQTSTPKRTISATSQPSSPPASATPSTAVPTTPNSVSTPQTTTAPSTPNQVRRLEGISTQQMQQKLMEQQQQIERLHQLQNASATPIAPTRSTPSTPATPTTTTTTALTPTTPTTTPARTPLSARRRPKVPQIESEDTDDEDDDDGDEDFTPDRKKRISKRKNKDYDSEEEEDDEDDHDDDEEEDEDEDEDGDEDDVDAEGDDADTPKAKNRPPKPRTLPFVFPSGAVLVALHRLFESLNQMGPIKPATTTSTTTTASDDNANAVEVYHSPVEPYVTLPEFKLLVAWFNSLFYISLKLFPQDLGEVLGSQPANN